MSKLTLDEVIKHEKRETEYQRNIARQLEENEEHPFYIRSNYKSAEYHGQIAKLLEELKRRREKDNEIMGSGALNNAYEQGYKKAIEDFVAKYKFCDNRSMQCRETLNCADCITKQLKKETEQALKKMESEG